MQNLKDFLASIPNDYDPETIYKNVLPILVEEKFLDVLVGKLTYKDFHKKLFQLAMLPHGVGIGVSLMAQINIAGRIMQLATKKNDDSQSINLLNGLATGKNVISLGVSEPEWKGRLSNIKTSITVESDKYLLTGEKSFFTNGYHSSHYLIVARQEGTYKVVLLEKEREGLEITKFTLPFAKEATHCKIKMNSVEIHKSDILDINYSDYAENLRLSEMLSLSAVFCGSAISTLENIKSKEDLVQIVKADEAKQKKLLNIKTLVNMLQGRILEIAEIKDTDETYELKKLFPYGTELVADEFYQGLEGIFSKEKIDGLFQEKQLFQYRDILNESYIRRAAKFTSGLLG